MESLSFTSYSQIGCFELHCNGSPWAAEGDDSIHIRLGVAAMIQAARSKGWQCVCTWEGYRDGVDRTVFIFRSGVAESNPRHCVLAPMESNRLGVYEAPAPVVERFSAVIRSHWVQGIKRKGVAGSHF